ncbi:ABC transporter substrate-binding protein [Microvirga sp. M2]|uniref:ABC transporter substrate-binding protein n=1 Tax=Microvirga sp. M2 TaxID=3073270 RepID=UPI0039C2E36B
MALLLTTFSPANAKTPDDTLIMAHAIDGVVSFDPAEVFEFAGGEFSNNIYLRLVVSDETDFTKIKGGAAEKWEISADGKTYTFKMRPNLTFATSGKPLTARDAAFSLQRVVKLSKSPAFILNQLGWSAENVDQMVRAVDDGTLQLQISEALAPSLVLNALSAGVAAVVDRETVMSHEKNGDLGHEWLRKNTAGAGAYRLVDWRPSEVVVLDSNKTFYRGAPPMNRIIIRHIPEATTQRLMLEKGDVDVARQLGSEQLEALSSNKDVKIEIEDKATVFYLGLNQAVPELAKPQVKEALRWLIDYDGIAEVLLKRQYRVHQAILGKGGFAALSDRPYKFDVGKAKALLAEAGYPNGFKMTLDVYASSPYKEIAEAVQANFAKAGIEVSLIASDRRQTLTQYRARSHQAVLMYWSPDYGDPHSTVDFFVNNPDNSPEGKTKTAAWRNVWKDPTLEELSRVAVRDPDTENRAKSYLQIQRTMQKESPMIVMFQQTEPVAMRTNVTGWISGPTFDTYIFWKIKK